MTRHYKAPGRPAKAHQVSTRYVIEFEDGTKRYYATGQSRYLALKELKEQGKDYLVKRQYITGNAQGIGN
jgi:hypothetical protein